MITSLKLVLVPLDERPVNTRIPEMLGAIGGAEVLLPPLSMRGFQRVPADLDAVAKWLQKTAQNADAAIVSCEYLGFGNLIASRITNDSAAQVLSRLHLLEQINPTCPIHAFSLITRVSNADDAVEEPEYWAEWGTTFYQYAKLWHQAELSVLEDVDALTEMETRLPEALKSDWLTRRLRNHIVNLGLLDMAARGTLTSLRLTSDDTSLYGLPSREQQWLAGWPDLIGPALGDRVMMHPGADEVGSAILAKLLMEHAGKSPRVFVVYSHAGGEHLVAPYEDRPVCETVEGQIHACGGRLTKSADGCDLVLGVATPVPGRTAWQPEYLAEDRATRTAEYAAFLGTLAEAQATGSPVALADTAYPNGSDPLLTEMAFAASLNLGKLAAYGAWNTAGNTLGVVVAQAFCTRLIGNDAGRVAAQNIFLAHRFLEDWGYQAVVRREARDEAARLWGRREPDPESDTEQAQLCAFIGGLLNGHLQALQAYGIGLGLRIVPGSTRLPWRRTFEVDFTLV